MGLHLAVLAVICPGDICMLILSLTIPSGLRNSELSSGVSGEDLSVALYAHFWT